MRESQKRVKGLSVVTMPFRSAMPGDIRWTIPRDPVKLVASTACLTPVPLSSDGDNFVEIGTAHAFEHPVVDPHCITQAFVHI